AASPNDLAVSSAVPATSGSAGSTAIAAGSLREQRVLALAGHPVVVTRRKAASDAERAPSDGFVAHVAPRLVRGAEAIDRAIAVAPLPPVPGDRPPRPVRLYAVGEDGTLVSAPWRDRAGEDAARDELALLSSHPGHPAFAPQEFFFGFDPA